MINILTILFLISTAFSKIYYLEDGVPKFFSIIPSSETNVFYTNVKEKKYVIFRLSMKNMDKNPFDYLYYDCWEDFNSSATFKFEKSVSEIKEGGNSIYYQSSNWKETNYFGFKFTSNYDLENVNVTISIYQDPGKAVANGIVGFLNYLIHLIVFIILAIIIIVVVIICVASGKCKKKTVLLPPQTQNNNPNQQLIIPQQPEYYGPLQPQYYPSPQPQILVQPQNQPIQTSIQ